jgi:hypothetical protein
MNAALEAFRRGTSLIFCKVDSQRHLRPHFASCRLVKRWATRSLSRNHENGAD